MTDEFLKAYLARPELMPPADACAVERKLHRELLGDPRRAVAAGELAAVADADAMVEAITAAQTPYEVRIVRGTEERTVTVGGDAAASGEA